MSDTVHFIFIMEIIGTIAFACSGAMVAIRKELDLLGVLVLGVVTAVGGGMFRDLLIGVHPPVLFTKPVYVTVALLSAAVIFLLVRLSGRARKLLESELYDSILNLMDAIGLGVFTIVGVNSAVDGDYGHLLFLKIFLGVITGVGGGLLRDMMVCEIPGILKRHIYACASLAGAFSYVGLQNYLRTDLSMIISTLLVILIRVLARRYKWNLPRAM